MATHRVVRAEILDDLPAQDPEAVRSRQDLRMINALMGNPGWVRRTLSKVGNIRRIVEVGAGDGRLCRKLHGWFPEAEIMGIDLTPRPSGLPADISWRRGDLFDVLPSLGADVVVAVMVLHHFHEERLETFGRLVRCCRTLCACEPWRAALPGWLGSFLVPFVGRVTRHDMPVSIAAGFLPGELPAALRLSGWHFEETVDPRGSLRVLAVAP